METSPVRQLLQQALTNDQRIDRAEFEAVRQLIESDGVVSPKELKPLIDALTQNQLDGTAVAPVIEFVARHQGEQQPEPTKQELVSPDPLKTETPKTEATKAPVQTVPETPAAPASPWKNTYTVQGNFNHTSVSSGWNGQYGSEKTATRIEGSFQADLNYQQDRKNWKNRLLVEYGNTFVKGDAERAVSRNNLEFTSEAGHTLEHKDKYKIEIPYATLYTKGPLTEIDGRKFRETTGAKITYTPTEHGDVSLKLGAGFQQSHDPSAALWKNEFGVEAVVEGKQSLGFMKAPLVKATGVKAESVGFLDRFEAQVQVNAFNPLQNGLAVSNTDIGIKLGGRYYLSDKKNVWVGAGQQWEYGGQANSTWERKFSADAGFKFD